MALRNEEVLSQLAATEQQLFCKVSLCDLQRLITSHEKSAAIIALINHFNHVRVDYNSLTALRASAGELVGCY